MGEFRAAMQSSVVPLLIHFSSMDKSWGVMEFEQRFFGPLVWRGTGWGVEIDDFRAHGYGHGLHLGTFHCGFALHL